MTGRDCDIALVGAGLAGGLAALALAQRRPDLAVRLIEQGPAPGGNHRWSWFASDLPPAGAALMAAFPLSEWADGYDVAFPDHRRHLPTPYRSLASADFAATLARALPPGTLLAGSPATALDAGGVTLADGGRIAARCVIDGRGFSASCALQGGWQLFMGRHLRLARPHGLARPIIMDATVEQLGGYRFVYVLPLAADEIFVEDTYYSDAPVLDRAALAARIATYCAAHGWQGETLGEETGVLPVIAGGDFPAFQRETRIAGVGRIGARGGFVHPLTSYTLPFAVETALAVAASAELPGHAMAAMLEARARRHWRATRFYRLLGTMLFGAARAPARYRMFKRFYRLPVPLIERFYAARSTMADRARILCGQPPVPVAAALRALATRRPSLKEAA